MQINRREFLVLTAAFVAGCRSVQNPEALSAGNRAINAGPASSYAADSVYLAFRRRGFFIVRQGSKLFALSSICTHRRCLLDAGPDRSFYCPCHGSTFDPNGGVTHGPAKRPLPMFETFINEKGEMVVILPAV